MFSLIFLDAWKMLGLCRMANISCNNRWLSIQVRRIRLVFDFDFQIAIQHFPSHFSMHRYSIHLRNQMPSLFSITRIITTYYRSIGQKTQSYYELEDEGND